MVPVPLHASILRRVEGVEARVAGAVNEADRPLAGEEDSGKGGGGDGDVAGEAGGGGVDLDGGGGGMEGGGVGGGVVVVGERGFGGGQELVGAADLGREEAAEVELVGAAAGAGEGGFDLVLRGAVGVDEVAREVQVAG